MIEGTFEVVVPSWSEKQGLQKWRNHNGATVLQLHYSADPEKTKEWAVSAAKKWPGGIDGALWAQEMEVEAEARFGSRVFPEFSRATHVVSPFKISDDAPRWRGIDPGLRDPLCCLWLALDKDPATGDDTIFVYREHYQADWYIDKHGPAIKAMSGKEVYEFTYVDPAAFRETLEAGEASIAAQFAKHGIVLVSAQRAAKKHRQIGPLASLMAIQGNGHPKLKVFATCPNTVRELTTWRYEERPEAHAEKRNPSENPLDKDNHAIDVLLYGAATINWNRARKVRGARVERQGIPIERENSDFDRFYAGAID